ncbi:hypothetical protein ACM614_26995 [Streptomyces sp. 12297]
MKAALIALVGSLLASLIGLVGTLVVVMNAPDGDSSAMTESPRPFPSQSSPPAGGTAGGPDSSSEESDPPSPSPSPSRASLSPTPPSPAPTPDAPPDPPDPTLPDPPPVEPPVPAPRPAREQWSGSLTLDGSAGVRGWFLDGVPPSRAPVGDLAIRGAYEMYSNYGLAAWTGGGAATRQQCAALLNSQPGGRGLSVRVGDRACFGTEGGRVGYARVVDAPDSQTLTLGVRVWERG